MCGVLGWSSWGKDARNSALRSGFITVLMVEMNRRGEKSWGAFNPDGVDGPVVMKGVGPIVEVPGLAPALGLLPRGFAHTRKPTKGDVTWENAHPFRMAGGMVGQHNGSIRNHEDLKKEWEVDYPVDSQYLLHAINHEMDCTKLTGHGVVNWWDPKTPEVFHLARMNGGDLGVAYVEKIGLVWASKMEAIKKACTLFGLDAPVEIAIEEGFVYTLGTEVTKTDRVINLTKPEKKQLAADQAATGSTGHHRVPGPYWSEDWDRWGGYDGGTVVDAPPVITFGVVPRSLSATPLGAWHDARTTGCQEVAPTEERRIVAKAAPEKTSVSSPVVALLPGGTSARTVDWFITGVTLAGVGSALKTVRYHWSDRAPREEKKDRVRPIISGRFLVHFVRVMKQKKFLTPADMLEEAYRVSTTNIQDALRELTMNMSLLATFLLEVEMGLNSKQDLDFEDLYITTPLSRQAEVYQVAFATVGTWPDLRLAHNSYWRLNSEMIGE